MTLKFREYCEAAELVDRFAEACLREDLTDEFGDRVLGGVGEFGKSVASGVGSLAVSPIKGLWRGIKRLALGGRGLDQSDAAAEFKQAKIDTMKALMNMDQDARKQEIDKFKQVLDQIGNYSSRDPQARDGMLMKILQHGTYRGWANPNYRKLAS